ncbi:DUF947-domain-containing protein [Macrolepiota fuliginosa MF-IS2]|uniref:rRNA biogenesis protein RRP36 n=1 Tax=Macrolepiota fuliginosa MF-IS2 TaxID=1400762 RepID=A0A9P5XLT4_9AGAR|nr:DUF947-domain-containing protein [Macrolepiota fuliginosa MF-IS2]
MPRRPRPSHRAPPHNEGAAPRKTDFKPSNNSLWKATKPLAVNEDDDSVNEEQYHDEESEVGRRGYYEEDGSEDTEEDEEDADAPRVSQWVDDQDFGGLGEGDNEEDEDEEEKSEAGPSQLATYSFPDLSTLPFGALRKAQYALSHAEAVTDSEDEDEDEDTDPDSVDAPVHQPDGGKKGVEWSTKPRTDIAKRSNKHAPTEVTSKKPVTRLRQVVEVKKIESRDPRFLSVAGEFKADKFQQNYGFLTEVHKSELGTLRDNVKRARKMVDNAPRQLRDDYEAEVQRLELAVKRTESIVNKERMDRIQQQALQRVSKDEKERRKHGKGSWYPKKSEKRELVTRARYEALAAEGGKRAVKKAIEKRQKKISQKEKKSRPFPKGGGGETRKRSADEDHGERKRRRVG